VQEVNNDRDSPLLLAVAAGNLELVRILIEQYGANLHHRDMSESTAVHCAAMYGNPAILR